MCIWWWYTDADGNKCYIYLLFTSPWIQLIYTYIKSTLEYDKNNHVTVKYCTWITLPSYQSSLLIYQKFPLWFMIYLRTRAIQSPMMTSSNGNIFRVTGPLCGEFTGPGEFPAQRPVTRSFDVSFDLRPNKWLSKQPWGWWFETPSWSLWRQCNARPLTSPIHPQPRTIV